MEQHTTGTLVRRIMGTYLRPYAGRIALALFWMIIASSMTGLFAWIIGPVMDYVMVPDNSAYILPICIILMISMVLRGGATYFHTVQMARIGHSVVADIQSNLFRHMLRLDLGFFQNNMSGSLVARVISDVQVMRSALNDGMTGIGKNLVTLIILVSIMFYRDWILAFAAFTIFPLVGAYVVKLGKKLRSISKRTQGAVSNMTAGLSQTFQAIRQVRAFGREDYEIERADTILHKVRDLNIKTTKTSNLSTPINDILVGIILFAVIYYGGLQVSAGEATAGDIMSFITAFLMAYEPMKNLAKLNNNFNIGLGAADRVFQILDTPIGIEVDHNKPHLKKSDIMPIQFKDVCFSYDGSKNVLEDINFTAHSGKVTALVGPSGGGKTTILNMIPRFFDVTSGQVTLAGQNIKDVSLSSLRDQIAWVSQDIIIFSGTVRENIAYGLEGASEEKIIEAAKSAYAHEFIMKLSNGYDTELGENGTVISGGQKQRIALARAFLKDAPILLLDEATSALDNESEHYIQASLERLQKGRTTVVIAHRLSTIEKADKIIVLDKGQIVEKGTHNHLLSNNGIYKKLSSGL